MDLLEFDVWDLSVDAYGTPRAFSCYKKTPFGLKSSAGGSDGSSTGIKLMLDNLKSKLHVPGIYAEVSHAMEAIAIKAGAPVVCNSLVAKILNKDIVPDEDQVHYVRAISGIGLARKVLVGNPLGIPTTSMSNPVCGIAASLQGKQEKVSHIADYYAHLACLL